MTPDGPVTPAGLRVCADLCATCVFRPGNPMNLRPGRLREMVDGSLQADSFIVCHDTLEGERAVCRGYWNRHQRNTLGTRLGALYGAVEVNPDGS